MGFLIDFLKQKAPKPGVEMPGYYKKGLLVTQWFLALYFLTFFLIFPWRLGRWELMPLFMLAGTLLSMYMIGRANVRLCLGTFGAVVIVWCVWFVRFLGWSYGCQHLLLLLLVLCFFDIYEYPWVKIAIFLLLAGVRMSAFIWSLEHPPVWELGRGLGIAIQMMNSLMSFVVMSSLFILFSSNIQDAERQLRLANQALHKEAGTDPLTQLPNRRAMLNVMERFMKNAPEEPFSVAIADIDFFKKVNDTYGHNCGDYTLKTLAALFRDFSQERYQVCRWGGEEFCFFIPGQNLDEAGRIMFDLCLAVKKMPLSYEGRDFNITITIGVEEYDYASPMEAILESADQKLYRGKIGGRNQVVM